MSRTARRARYAWAPLLGAVAAIALAASSATAALPDGRAYEMVSPPGKGGGDVMIDSSRTRAAQDGSAAGFVSLRAFGDAAGTGIATDYLSVRSTDPSPGDNGWTTHAITPRQDPLSLLADFQALDPLYEGEFSPNLDKGVFRAWSPLSPAPMVADIENLYLRTDLRNPGAGSYQFLSDCSACLSPIALPPSGPNANQLPRLAGASADFSHVIFQSQFQLTNDAPANSNAKLYEWTVAGGLRYVGILPDGSTAIRSLAGQGTGQTPGGPPKYTLRTISADGSRIFFTVPAVFNPAATSGALYMRDDMRTTDTSDDTTTQVNASERTDCADNNPCTGVPEPDPNGPQPATFRTASTDGTRVFFTTSEQLTDDDDNSSIDLYMWDSTGAPGHRLTRLSVDHEPIDPPGDVQGVLGASENGHYVYFVAAGQLVAGKQDLGGTDFGLYAWHDGTLAYVGRANPADSQRGFPSTWGLSQLRSRVTPDGRFLLFGSTGGDGLLSAHGGTDVDQTSHCADGGTCVELYVYDAAADSLACASCVPGGAPSTASADSSVRTGTSASDNTWHLNHPLSDDGRRVFFSTSEALVPEDTNGKTDAYEYDTQTHQVHLISTGTSTTNSYFMDASANGGDAFVLTQQRLVGWDTDSNYDLYDARVGGGFPDPTPTPPACSGDSCQGGASAPPAAPGAGSVSFQGPGNVKSAPRKPAAKKKPAVKCRRGFVRKRVRGKVRCVRAPRHRATRAATHRRAK